MFIVITAEDLIKNEVEILKNMANYPITIHVRKPKWSHEKMKAWLAAFSNIETSKMMLHQHHELSTLFTIKGLHYTEKHKADSNLNTELEQHSKSELTLSASFHDLKEAESQTLFDYNVLSPVFDSISKPNYEGKLFQIQNNLKPIMALGGIKEDNIAITKALGFNGMAVLGSIWKTSNPTRAFMDLFKVYRQHY
ncbi:thiamine phosphate synthase [Flavobacteriaceae bacterium Ap0902]|nr:thiamine phosphate synthase [Flavobacteriaceae bacterium Ap0902]